MKTTAFVLFFILKVSLYCFAQDLPLPENRFNSDEHLNKPYVILVSLDGYRHDYLNRFRPQNMTERVRNGVHAQSLVPCYPSKTFPNHYSIATGMYPENHGLVGNTFYDSKLDGFYKISDREKVENGDWYNGTPIWTNAELQGMISANYFFVGSEADVKGIRPTHWRKYDGSISKEDRVNQVVKWLKLPEKKRPHIISMYFSDIDSKTHRVGPDHDEEIKPIIDEVDGVLGSLFDQIDSLDLPINVIVVSDHGMMSVPVENMLPQEMFESEEYDIANNGTYLHVYPKKEMDLDELKKQIEAKSEHVSVVKVKGSEYYSTNQENHRLGELLVIADDHYTITGLKKITAAKMMGKKVIGQHGYPIDNKDMHGVFYAFGPNIKPGIAIPSFKNIHVYPLICEILGLDIPDDIDGSKDVLENIIQR